MKVISEDTVEQAELQWLSALSWQIAHGPDISLPEPKATGGKHDRYS
jgi:type I restriction enzyme R subunit